MIITKQFIMDNRTAKGAWTKKQIEALGITYPPTKGWIQDVIGKRITEQKSGEFIEGKYHFSKSKKQQEINSKRYIDIDIVEHMISKTMKEVDGLIPGELTRIMQDNLVRNLRKL